MNILSVCVLVTFLIALINVTNAAIWPRNNVGRQGSIRPLPCSLKTSGEKGVCMFAWDCFKQKGIHLGTCVDRFYVGSCCKLENKVVDLVSLKRPTTTTTTTTTPFPFERHNVTTSTTQIPAVSSSTISNIGLLLTLDTKNKTNLSAENVTTTPKPVFQTKPQRPPLWKPFLPYLPLEELLAEEISTVKESEVSTTTETLVTTGSTDSSTNLTPEVTTTRSHEVEDMNTPIVAWLPPLTVGSSAPAWSSASTAATNFVSTSTEITTIPPTTEAPTTVGEMDSSYVTVESTTNFPSTTQEVTSTDLPEETETVITTQTTEPTTQEVTEEPSTTVQTTITTEETSTLEQKEIGDMDYLDVCGRQFHHDFPIGRIVGGVKAEFAEWPWQVSLRQWKRVAFMHKCGAALINENWAITAAHCIESTLFHSVSPTDLVVRMGEYNTVSEKEPLPYVEREVQLIVPHPRFDPKNFENDLALLRFYEPVRFQKNIIPICLPTDNSTFLNQSATVTGWGRLFADGPLPQVLQEVSVPIITNADCERMYKKAGFREHIPEMFICAGVPEGGKDSCEGDSGGPLVVQRSDNRFVLAGIISWGIGCAEPNQPGVYSRISHFRDWINTFLQI